MRHNEFGLGVEQHVLKSFHRIGRIERDVDLACLEYGENSNQHRGAMFHQNRDGKVAFAASVQDCVSYAICPFIQFCVGNSLCPFLNCYSIWIPLHYLLEALGDRLLDLLFCELLEPPRWMETLRPNG